MLASYVFWERDEAATLLAEIMGVVSASSENNDILARARAAAGSGEQASAVVEEIAAELPATGPSSCPFAKKVKLACTGDDAADACRCLEQARESRMDAFDDVVDDGYALLCGDGAPF